MATSVDDDIELQELQQRINEQGENYVPELFSLPKRATRGNKMENLIANEDKLEEDDFWKQDQFQDEENDDEFEDLINEEDEADADFDEPEIVEAEPEVNLDEILRREEQKEKQQQKKSYVDPKGKMFTKRAVSMRTTKDSSTLLDAVEAAAGITIETSGEKETVTSEKKSAKKRARTETLKNEKKPIQVDLNRQMSLRRTTQVQVEKCERKRSAIAEAKKWEPKKKRKVRVQRQHTQTELLAEAKRTEKKNLDELEQMIKLFEEKKELENQLMRRKKYVGPLMSIVSKTEQHGNERFSKTTIVFNDEFSIPPVLAHPQLSPFVHSDRLVSFSKPAKKYIDPLTKIEFDNIAEFSTIRNNHTSPSILKYNTVIYKLHSALSAVANSSEEERTKKNPIPEPLKRTIYTSTGKVSLSSDSWCEIMKENTPTDGRTTILSPAERSVVKSKPHLMNPHAIFMIAGRSVGQRAIVQKPEPLQPPQNVIVTQQKGNAKTKQNPKPQHKTNLKTQKTKSKLKPSVSVEKMIVENEPLQTRAAKAKANNIFEKKMKNEDEKTK